MLLNLQRSLPYHPLFVKRIWDNDIAVSESTDDTSEPDDEHIFNDCNDLENIVDPHPPDVQRPKEDCWRLFGNNEFLDVEYIPQTCDQFSSV